MSAIIRYPVWIKIMDLNTNLSYYVVINDESFRKFKLKDLITNQ